MSEQAGRKIGYDLLRVLACFIIVLVHETHIPKTESIASIISAGSGCVQIFFVMSGWWAAITFDKNNPTIKDYYKKRFIRILPPYYLAVFVIIVLNVFIWGGVRIRDIYGIGYFRYFLALNTLLPSNNYEVWNNLYGLWTMGDFIWFYCFAPFFLRKCDCKKSLCYFRLLPYG